MKYDGRYVTTDNSEIDSIDFIGSIEPNPFESLGLYALLKCCFDSLKLS